jgi:hypothetical protein
MTWNKPPTEGPNNPAIFQAGLTVVTPAGVARLWKKVQEKKLTLEEAWREMQELASEEVDT